MNDVDLLESYHMILEESMDLESLISWDPIDDSSIDLEYRFGDITEKLLTWLRAFTRGVKQLWATTMDFFNRLFKAAPRLESKINKFAPTAEAFKAIPDHELFPYRMRIGKEGSLTEEELTEGLERFIEDKPLSDILETYNEYVDLSIDQWMNVRSGFIARLTYFAERVVREFYEKTERKYSKDRGEDNVLGNRRFALRYSSSTRERIFETFKMLLGRITLPTIRLTTVRLKDSGQIDSAAFTVDNYEHLRNAVSALVNQMKDRKAFQSYYNNQLTSQLDSLIEDIENHDYTDLKEASMVTGIKSFIGKAMSQNGSTIDGYLSHKYRVLSGIFECYQKSYPK